ncbi:MAG: TadE/TadG family type IV pilus assembly protein [Candidatus Limnocylindria bacterium]
MSFRLTDSQISRRASGSHHGQSLVELALVLPLLIVLLLGAIDFGRVFFGWVAMQNAARVGANYASTHPDAWTLTNPLALSQRQEYRDLVLDSGSTNCTLTPSTPAPPSFPDGTRGIGDRTRVDLNCNFALITPLMGSLVGQGGLLRISADATFPIRQGCANCGSSGTAPPPPPPPNCRAIPSIVGLSVSGARAAWTAAGFTGVFTPVSGEDARTVATRNVDQHGEVGCNGSTNAFFSSSVSVTLAAIVTPAPGETCRTVPNLKGMTVAAARQAWQNAGFLAGNFVPATGNDAQIVQTQTFTPASLAGECQEPATLNVQVTSGPAPPPPPPPPCKVPSLVNTLRSAAQGSWGVAGFTTTVKYQPPAANWTVIKSQTLVGGSYAGCGALITVSKNG